VRFWRFNAVGVLGFAVQLGVLALLVHAGVHYLAATAMAVEAAILHNFAWHERWTWRDRPASGRARLARLLRFHALNGGVSLAGNVLIMRVLVGLCGMPPLPSNVMAVLACAAVNFLGADRLVFSRRIMPPAFGEEASKWA
jgi:putative flippase GtrA